MTIKRSLPIGLWALLLLIPGCRDGVHFTEATEPGFTNAAFDEAGLQVLFGDPDCVWVRFYNVYRAAADAGTVMAVAVDRYGKEYPITNAKVYYRVSDKIVGQDVSYLEWERPAARQGCNWLRNAGGNPVACELSTKTLKKMLALKDCNGLQVTPTLTNGQELTMQFDAVNLHDGVVRVLSGPGTSVICGEPCPTLCSDDVDYVHDEP